MEKRRGSFKYGDQKIGLIVKWHSSEGKGASHKDIRKKRTFQE